MRNIYSPLAARTLTGLHGLRWITSLHLQEALSSTGEHVGLKPTRKALLCILCDLQRHTNDRQMSVLSRDDITGTDDAACNQKPYTQSSGTKWSKLHRHVPSHATTSSAC